MNRLISTLPLLFCLLIFNSKAFAVAGSYSGTLTGNENQFFPVVAGPFPISSVFLIAVDELTLGGSLSATGLITSGDFINETFSMKGTVTSSGNVSGNFTAGNGSTEKSNGTFTGTVNTSTFDFNINISGTDTASASGGLSTYTYSGTLSFSGTGADVVFNPTVTPGSVVTDQLTSLTQILDISSNITAHISNSLMSGGSLRGSTFNAQKTGSGLMVRATGLNAGDESILQPLGMWASYSYSDFENDLSSMAYDGSRHTFSLGLDTSLTDNSLLGVSLSYEFADIDTSFNRGKQESKGYTVAPYAGVLLNDVWSLGLSFGYSNIDTDQFRRAPGGGGRITSKPDTVRLFGVFNIDGVKTHGNWIFAGRSSLLYAASTQDAFTESSRAVINKTKFRIGQISVGGDVAYSYEQFEPYLSVLYSYDYQLTEISVVSGKQPSNDRDDISIALGVRYFSVGGITGNFEWSKRLARDDFDEDSFMLTVRGEF